MKNMKKWELFVIIHILFCFIQTCETLEPITSGVAVGTAFVASLGFGAFEYFKCFMHECCSKAWIRQEINATELTTKLQAKVYGQHLAMMSVVKHVKAHLHNSNPSKALALSLHGWTGTGKNFISQIVAEYIFTKGMDSAFVHLISVDKTFPHSTPEYVIKYKIELKELIESRIARCDRSLFIFDEIDKMPSGVLDVIKPYLEYYDKLDGVTYRRAMFLFLSNEGGAAITKFTLNHFILGHKREEITLKDLENTISIVALNAENKAGLWHSELITKHLVTAFVPFLPLEKRHVRNCTRDIMLARNFTHAEIRENIETVLDELRYYPPDEQRFSTTGCKRVAEKIDFVMTPGF